MNKYIKPQMSITKFNAECVSTDATVTPLPTQGLSYVPPVGDGVSNVVDGAQSKIVNNVQFQDAIKYK